MWRCQIWNPLIEKNSRGPQFLSGTAVSSFFPSRNADYARFAFWNQRRVSDFNFLIGEEWGLLFVRPHSGKIAQQATRQ